MTNQLGILSGSTDGWQEGVGLPGEEDHERASRDLALGSLREELSLITNAENLVVLAGSGASLGIGDQTGLSKPPSMWSLWAEVQELESFKTVKSQLNVDAVNNGNFEHVLSDAQTRQAIMPDDTDLKTFINEAESIVLANCSFIRESSDLETHELFLRKVARRSTRLQRTQIFTTNYDLAFETAARRARFNVIDGFGYGGQDFDGSSFDLDYVRRRPHEPLALEPSVFHLLKLHGSVDWDSNDGIVQKIYGGGRPTNPVLIYPSSAKYQLSYQQPYFEFMSRFQIALRQPDVGLIIVGFGFNDEHLSAPIEAAIRSNVGLRAVLVSPGLRQEASRSKTISWFEHLIHKGDRRLTMLEGTFDDVVKYLPDVPLHEDRDVHADRVSSRN